MKNTKKVILAAFGALLTGAGAVGISMKAMSNNDVTAIDNSNVSLVNNNIRNFVVKVDGGKSASFDIASIILNGLQDGAGKLIGTGLYSLAQTGFNAILTQMGFDMRSVEEKGFDKLESQIDQLQKSLEKGIGDIERKMVEIHNKDVMCGLLDKVKSVQTPIASKMAVLAEISRKELAKEDANEIKKEKETFLKSLNELKFNKLSENNLWNATERLAESISEPYQVDKTLGLFDLYEDTYGSIETWDYMTIAPRKQFIAYLGFIVNSLAQLAKLQAAYQMNQLKENDANRKDYENGVQAMVKAVTNVNNILKEELDKLAEIQKDHDEKHIMTHRDRVIGKDGKLTIKKGISVSTRLMPVTTGDNDDNYISYDYTGKNLIEVQRGPDGQSWVYQNCIYTLNCDAQKDLYKTVINEYKDYNASLGKTNFSDFTVKDYLLKAGFTCQNKEGFDKAKGFYKSIDVNSHDGSRENFWRTDKCNDLRVSYYDFSKADDSGKATSTYDTVNYYKSGWFSSGEWSVTKTSDFNNYYLTFLDADQKTILGDLKKTVIEKVGGENAKGDKWSKHFRGHRTLSDNKQTKVTIDK